MEADQVGLIKRLGVDPGVRSHGFSLGRRWTGTRGVGGAVDRGVDRWTGGPRGIRAVGPGIPEGDVEDKRRKEGLDPRSWVATAVRVDSQAHPRSSGPDQPHVPAQVACPREPRVLPSVRWGCYTLAAPDLQGCGASHGRENPGATPSLTSKWTFQSATMLLSPENAHLPASLLGTLSRSPSGQTLSVVLCASISRARDLCHTGTCI